MLGAVPQCRKVQRKAFMKFVVGETLIIANKRMILLVHNHKSMSGSSS